MVNQVMEIGKSGLLTTTFLSQCLDFFKKKNAEFGFLSPITVYSNTATIYLSIMEKPEQ